jgi:hypothetical protein
VYKGNQMESFTDWFYLHRNREREPQDLKTRD